MENLIQQAQSLMETVEKNNAVIEASLARIDALLAKQQQILEEMNNGK